MLLSLVCGLFPPCYCVILRHSSASHLSPFPSLSSPLTSPSGSLIVSFTVLFASHSLALSFWLVFPGFLLSWLLSEPCLLIGHQYSVVVVVVCCSSALFSSSLSRSPVHTLSLSLSQLVPRLYEGKCGGRFSRSLLNGGLSRAAGFQYKRVLL